MTENTSTNPLTFQLEQQMCFKGSFFTLNSYGDQKHFQATSTRLPKVTYDLQVTSMFFLRT